MGARREGGVVIPNLYPHVMYGLLEILVGLGEGRGGGLCIALEVMVVVANSGEVVVVWGG